MIRVLNKKITTKRDDDLQKILFDKVKEMVMSVDDKYIDLKKIKIKFDDDIEFFKLSYDKIYTGDKEIRIIKGQVKNSK
jgi:hypothetical protein